MTRIVQWECIEDTENNKNVYAYRIKKVKKIMSIVRERTQ